MSKASYVSALILVEEPSSVSGAVASPPMKYALLPTKAMGCIDASLLENGIEILKDVQFTLPKSSKLEVLHLVMEFSKAEGTFVGLCVVPKANRDFLKRLLSKTPIVWGSWRAESISVTAYDQFYCTAFATEEEMNLRALKKLLVAGVDTALIHPKGGSLLHLAADQGSHGRRLIELLCAHGVSVSATRKDGATPFHLAVASKYNVNGNMESVQILLEKGACVGAEFIHGVTPLHIAANAGWLSCVKILLAHGAKVDVKKTNDWTPLHLAVFKGCLKVAQLLVEEGAELAAKTKCGKTLLHLAAFPKESNLYVPLVQWLIQNGVDIDAADVFGDTALHYAVQELPHVLKFLTERGADINIQNNAGETPLLVAVTQNLIASFELLVSLYPDFNIPGNKKAFYVAMGKRVWDATGMVKQMVQYGFRLSAEDANNPDILFNAIHKGLSEIVQCLLTLGADVNQHHTFLKLKITPLRHAIRRNQKDVVQTLLDFGANVSEESGQLSQRTLIEEAVEFADVDIINMLMAKGVKVRDTPLLLHIATESQKNGDKGSFSVIKLLIEEGFDWSARESQRLTPLNTVIDRKNFKALEVMLSFGAQINYCSLAETRFCSGIYALYAPRFLHVFLSNCFILPSPYGEVVLRRLLTGESFFSWDVKRCVKALAEHLLKLEAVHANFSSKSFFNVSKFGLDGFRSQCEIEVESMKLQKVGRADLTLFDVLNKSSTQIALCARDRSLLEKLKSCDFKSKFPLYSNILSTKCGYGCLRRERLNRGIEILNAFSPQFFCLPDELKDIVINYLSDQDLVALQKSIFIK